MKTYRIWCEVYGGVLGRREGYARDGKTYLEYETLEEAQKVADQWNNREPNPYSLARYRYRVKEV
jgi:hypothetical protein